MRRLAIVAVIALAACSSTERPSSPRRAEPRPTAPTTIASSPAPPPPVFEGTATTIDEATRARMTSSWRPGCPVALDDLRLLRLDHWGYDGLEHRGELVVHADQADAVLGAFRALYDDRFPIERMQLVDTYGADDFASTVANNTAGFNCRFVVGKPGSWSEHAFGRAIDVNPLVNPYVLEPRINDVRLAPFLDRSLDVTGLIRAEDAAVTAFAAAGWAWGGAWSAPDYQHFSFTGR